MPLMNLFKNWSLAACSTNVSRMQEKKLKLLRPQGKIIDIKCEKSQIDHF